MRISRPIRFERDWPIRKFSNRIGHGPRAIHQLLERSSSQFSVSAFKSWQRLILQVLMILFLLHTLGGVLQTYNVTNTTRNSRNNAAQLMR